MRDLEQIRQIQLLELFVDALRVRVRVGSNVVLSNLASDLEISPKTIIDKKIHELIEVKNSDSEISTSLKYYADKLKPKQAIQIVGDLKRSFDKSLKSTLANDNDCTVGANSTHKCNFCSNYNQ